MIEVDKRKLQSLASWLRSIASRPNLESLLLRSSLEEYAELLERLASECGAKQPEWTIGPHNLLYNRNGIPENVDYDND